MHDAMVTLYRVERYSLSVSPTCKFSQVGIVQCKQMSRKLLFLTQVNLGRTVPESHRPSIAVTHVVESDTRSFGDVRPPFHLRGWITILSLPRSDGPATFPPLFSNSSKRSVLLAEHVAATLCKACGLWGDLPMKEKKLLRRRCMLLFALNLFTLVVIYKFHILLYWTHFEPPTCRELEKSGRVVRYPGARVS